MTDTDKTTEKSAPARRQGRLQTWRVRWFGERDEVADQFADIARQGSGMARLAHVCASLMLVLFSAGSLVALGGDALLLSVYLAMARPLPVTARNILAQVELASGLGLIRDAVTIANDSSASLSQKVALFGTSAVMTPQDRERLDGLLVAVERGLRETPQGNRALNAPEDPQRESAVGGQAVRAAQNGHSRPLALGPGR
jgi:hypothetical protein